MREVVHFHDWYVLKLFPNPQPYPQAPLDDVPSAHGKPAVQRDFVLYVSKIHQIIMLRVLLWGIVTYCGRFRAI